MNASPFSLLTVSMNENKDIIVIYTDIDIAASTTVLCLGEFNF